MTPIWANLLGGGGIFALVAALLVYIATRKRDRASETKDRFDQADELNRYIDERVAKITGPMSDKIERLEKLIEKMGDRDAKVKNILRGFFQRLRFWDQHGREGEMPLPSAEEMAVLELDIDASTPATSGTLTP